MTEEFDDFCFNKKDLIGHGAFAVVYKGKYRTRSTEVAIKAVAKKNLAKAKTLLQKEIKILTDLKGLKHDNLVSLLKCVETNQFVYLIMEFCNGGDLADYLHAKGAINEATIQHFFKQIAQALEAINKRGIVHRDLKPQNILLCNPPQRVNPAIHDIVVKLADFGFARFLNEGNMAGTLCGSPMYMAPEVIMSLQYDAKADLWSIGTIMYQCLTGKAPFVAQTPQALKNYYERNRDLQPTIPNYCSQNLADLLLKLLKRNAKERIDFNDFFNHKFLHQSTISSPSKRILEQQRLSPNHIRRTPSADHHHELVPGHLPPQALHRVGSEQSYQINTNLATNIRPATVTRALPATYTTSPITRRSENHSIPTRTSSRDISTPSHEYVYGTPSKQQPSPLRPQKSAPNNQAMTDSGEFTFLPPLNQQQNSGTNTPRSSRQNSSNSQQNYENAVKQVQVHSSKTSPPSSSRNSTRAVPVPSQRLAFAKMEQERQNSNMKDRPSTTQEPAQSELNFEDMRTNVEELNPPQTKFLIREIPKSRLPSRTNRFRRPTVDEEIENSEPLKAVHSPTKIPKSSTSESINESANKPAVDNIRYLSTSPGKSNNEMADNRSKKLELSDEEDDVDDVLNEFAGNVPFAAGLSVESSSSQMMDNSISADDTGTTSSGVYSAVNKPTNIANNKSANTNAKSATPSSPHRALSALKEKNEEVASTLIPPSSIHSHNSAPVFEAPPELEDETLMNDEHRQVLAKLRFVLELTDMLIGVAENNTNTIAMLVENNARRPKEQSTDAYRRAEQLILYVKVMHIISSSLVMAQRHRDSATLQPSPAVQHVLNQLNDTYHQCLARSQELASLGVPSGSDPSTTVVSAERIMYRHAIELCQSAAMDELVGNPQLCPKRYKAAYMMLHTLSQQVQSEHDRTTLERYKNAVETRLKILENQGYVIAITNK